ncbi:citrate lyase subunit alpha/citrate CoA-transferase [Rhodovulum marinum]|uniref:Citrate lyase subunit alpha/citrate CoA-transferase n=1 Tax=Rhodovulum marinum TaxID=320662 RepID=A0A4R2PY00_9RHOB|nr:citrate lyase subunit alpha/citrate CoA-transferase [Rhodovulum marinum]
MTGPRPPLPAEIPGYGPVRPYAAGPVPPGRPGPERAPNTAPDKRAPSLAAALRAAGLRDGATVSFHHHLRNGDAVLNMGLAELAALGLGDLHLAASSLFPVHAPLADHIRRGTVTRLSTAYISGPVAHALDALAQPATLQTHGGRARAIEAGELPIDLAIIAAPMADRTGNLTGALGPSACGPLGYPMVEAARARHVIAVTDCLSPTPLTAPEIPGHQVDQVVTVPRLGDAGQIVSGTTRPTDNPQARHIAALAARVIAASGLLADGISFQTGAGGISLAAARDLGQIMAQRGITGSFASGGITGTLVDLFRAGLFRDLLDVQCFDLAAVASFREDAAHRAMSASDYANPWHPDPVAHRLDAVILGAAEVDLDFNVNVTLGADGVILGGSGGHADTAAGAKLTVITTALTARGTPKIVPRVGCITTPGDTVDVIVTEAGLAVNPRRPDLADRLRHAGLPLTPIADLVRAAGSDNRPCSAQTGPIRAVSHYRDGRVTDVIRAP